MKKILPLISFCIIGFTSQAQISITSTNMPSSGDTARYSIADLNSVGDYTTTGANHTWTFTTVQPTGQGLRKFQPSMSTPYGFFFTPPKYGEKTLDTVKIPGGFTIPGLPSMTDMYSFYKKTSGAFSAEGIGIKLAGFPVPNFYSDEDELYVLPLDYLDRDSTTFKFSTITTTLIPLTYKKQGHRITEVDGWGTITTPYGTDACLRVVTTQYSMDSLKGSLAIAGFTVPVNVGFPNYMRSYQWLTAGEKIPYFEVSGNVVNGNFTATQARYRDVLQSFVGIKENTTTIALSVFPNPANTEVSIVLPKTESAVTAQLCDLQGKIIKTQHLDQNTGAVNQHKLNVSGLAAGLYILNLHDGKVKQSLKISIQ